MPESKNPEVPIPCTPVSPTPPCLRSVIPIRPVILSEGVCPNRRTPEVPTPCTPCPPPPHTSDQKLARGRATIPQYKRVPPTHSTQPIPHKQARLRPKSPKNPKPPFPGLTPKKISKINRFTFAQVRHGILGRTPDTRNPRRGLIVLEFRRRATGGRESPRHCGRSFVQRRDSG
jgi:hypothetical protein